MRRRIREILAAFRNMCPSGNGVLQRVVLREEGEKGILGDRVVPVEKNEGRQDFPCLGRRRRRTSRRVPDTLP